MRTRFVLLLSCSVLVLLLLPSVSLAAIDWSASKVTVDTKDGWTKEQSVVLEFYGSASWVAQMGFQGMGLQVFLSGSGLAGTAGQIGYDDGGESLDQVNGVMVATEWCRGDAKAALSPGDGQKQLALRFRLDALVNYSTPMSYWGPTFDCTVNLDTHGPKTIAPYPLSCKRGGYATVSYQVDDSASPKADVSLRVTNSKGKTVAKASIGEQETGKLLTYLWKCPLGAGKYKYSILATDLAGNKASKAGKNTLTVK